MSAILNTSEYNIFAPKDNYIYMHHTKTFMILPVYPDNISDKMTSQFNTSQPMLRSAPIYSYSHSGPREVSFNFTLHRDLMNVVNETVSNIPSGSTPIDYVDTLVRQLQAISVPRYDSRSKLVDPPMVSVRVGDEIFIKGIVQGGISLNYMLPLIEINGKKKYAQIEVGFTVHEVDPYDATTVMANGSFRGFSEDLERTWQDAVSLTNPNPADIQTI